MYIYEYNIYIYIYIYIIFIYIHGFMGSVYGFDNSYHMAITLPCFSKRNANLSLVILL